jgi:pyridoxine 5'-phosphate synthase PdxJ
MLRRHIDFIAVLFIAVVMIAVSKAAAFKVAPVEIYTVRFDNASNTTRYQISQELLSDLASLLNQ